MLHNILRAFSGALILLCAGCMSGPQLDNPLPLPPIDSRDANNPALIPANDYALVYEAALDVIDDYFEIRDANRYSGRIETFPRVAPGVGQPWKPGSPDLHERWLATLQSLRHRAVVLIQAADGGGYFVDVKVFKELEDLPQPSDFRASPAIFRADTTIARQYDVVDPSTTTVRGRWIPLGRDIAFEQKVLEKIVDLKRKSEEGEDCCSVSSFFSGLFSKKSE